MTFSREEVVEEFREAVLLGGTWTHEAQIAAWEGWTIGRRRERLRRPPSVAYAITPLPVESVRCPRCGAPCERRAGMKQLIHPGRHCSK